METERGSQHQGCCKPRDRQAIRYPVRGDIPPSRRSYEGRYDQICGDLYKFRPAQGRPEAAVPKSVLALVKIFVIETPIP